MTIEVEQLGYGEADTWNRCVERSTEATGFHRQEFLDVVRNHADATLHQFVGYNGNEPVGIFPLFELRKGPVHTVFSPPPRLGIPYLGPATVGMQGMKQRKVVQTNQEFIEGCLEVVDETVDPSYVHIKAVTGYDDIRPFQWAGFQTTPRYTFTLPLHEGVDELKSGFSRSLRRYLDPGEDEDVTVEERGREAIDFVLEQVADRYDEQDKSFTVPRAFVYDLWDSMPDGYLRAYVGSVDGEEVSGVITLESPECAYFLLGGGKSDVGYPINDLLHWRIARDAAERGVAEYDLMGANVAGIARYKSKFNPTLKMYAELERGTIPMRIASGVYRLLR
jgi:hypothetical protein